MNMVTLCTIAFAVIKSRISEHASMMKMPIRRSSLKVGLYLLILLSPLPPIPAQTQGTSSTNAIQGFAPGSDPAAIALASQSIVALIGNNAIQDVTLTGNVMTGSGNSAIGSITLRAVGSTESRLDAALPDGTRTEIRDYSAGYPQGKWVNPDGTSGVIAGHNTMTDPVWFFPAFSSLAANPNVVLTYIGHESRNGTTVQHVRTYAYQPSPPGQSLTVQELTTVDFYLDAGDSLPMAVVFNQHPDSNARVNIPVEVDFSNYRTLNGVLVPMHIQRIANGTTIFDITLTSAVFNSGLKTSDFSVNQ